MSMLENLKEIKDARTIVPTRKKTLDLLIGVWEEIQAGSLKDEVDRYFDLKNNARMYSGFVSSFFKDISFDEHDLSDFIFAKANSEQDYNSSLRLGFYTGLMLSTLNKRYKKLKLHINGHGNRFDYLFGYANKIHELTVENFTGDNICSNIGLYGYIHFLRASNIKGTDLCEVAGMHGIIDTLILDKNEGNDIGGSICRNGYADTVLLINNAAHNIGTVACTSAKINFIGVIQNKGMDIMNASCLKRSRVKYMVLADNIGDIYLRNMGQLKSTISHLYHRNNSKLIQDPSNAALKHIVSLDDGRYYPLMQVLGNVDDPHYTSSDLIKILRGK
jgi:hypothetical protein